jgi:hypothetical protein
MIYFELVASDFWGKHPEKMQYMLNEEVSSSFRALVRQGLKDVEDRLVRRETGKNLVTRAQISKKHVDLKIDVSANMRTVVLNFKAISPSSDKVGAFYAYAMCAVMSELGSVSTSVMGNDYGTQTIEIALSASSAAFLVDYLVDLSFFGTVETG